MDDLSKALTKAISNLLEQNENRLSDLQKIQENYAKKVDSLEAEVDALGIKCKKLGEENVETKRRLNEEAKIKLELTEENARIKRELTEENANIKRELTEANAKIKLELNEENTRIKLELNDSKCRQDSQETEIHDLRSVLDQQRKDMDVCKSWANCISCIYTQVHNFAEAREVMEKKLNDFDKILTRLTDQQMERHKPQFSSLRKPTNLVKSPSTSLILNGGSSYGSMSRYRTRTLGSFDVEEDSELQDISDHAEHLTRGVEALNDLQRSFEKNSLYSDD